jgi:hypothetical protein
MWYDVVVYAEDTGFSREIDSFNSLTRKLCRKSGAKDVYIWGMVFGENLSNLNKQSLSFKGTKWEPFLLKSLQNRRVIKLIGADFCVCLTKDGSVFQWGNLGKEKPITTPHYIKSFRGKRIIDIAGSPITKHVLALTDQGEVYGWGSNKYGQLCRSIADRFNAPFFAEPILLSFISKKKVAKIFAGGSEEEGKSCFITRSGAAYGCGYADDWLPSASYYFSSDCGCGVPQFIERKDIVTFTFGLDLVYTLNSKYDVIQV